MGKLEASVETPILYRLGDVLGGDGAFPGEVCDGACHAQDAVVAARREEQARKRVAQELVAFAVGLAITVDFPGAEERVRLSLPLELDSPGGFHPAPH